MTGSTRGGRSTNPRQISSKHTQPVDNASEPRQESIDENQLQADLFAVSKARKRSLQFPHSHPQEIPMQSPSTDLLDLSLMNDRLCPDLAPSQCDQRQSDGAISNVSPLELRHSGSTHSSQDSVHDLTSCDYSCPSIEQFFSTSAYLPWICTADSLAAPSTKCTRPSPKQSSAPGHHEPATFTKDTTTDRHWSGESVDCRLASMIPGVNDKVFDQEIPESLQLDFWNIPLTTEPLHNEVMLDPETKNALTRHYFDYVCQILSCFDSHENPFRADIPQKMLTCDYIHDCIVGMSAAHLANSVSGMEDIALRHRDRVVLALSSVVDTISPSEDYELEQYWLQCSSTRNTRHHALIASLLLGISSVSTRP